VGLFFPEKRED